MGCNVSEPFIPRPLSPPQSAACFYRSVRCAFGNVVVVPPPIIKPTTLSLPLPLNNPWSFVRVRGSSERLLGLLARLHAPHRCSAFTGPVAASSVVRPATPTSALTKNWRTFWSVRCCSLLRSIGWLSAPVVVYHSVAAADAAEPEIASPLLSTRERWENRDLASSLG